MPLLVAISKNLKEDLASKLNWYTKIYVPSHTFQTKGYDLEILETNTYWQLKSLQEI